MKQVYYILLLLTGCIVVYKTVHYRRHFSGKNIMCWLYFGRNEIMLSSTAGRRVAKERQNALSVMTIVSCILSFCLYFLMY